jgi:hypothetical protein
VKRLADEMPRREYDEERLVGRWARGLLKGKAASEGKNRL